MNTVSISLPPELIHKLKLFYEDHKQEVNNPYAEFVAKNLNCTVTVYKSGKVLFQGKGASSEAKLWETFEAEKKSKIKPITHSKTSPINPGLESINNIGSDEVGTGDYFGPITVCACYVDEDRYNQIKHLGIQDSKVMTDDKILKLAPELKKILPFSLLALPNEKYNELIDSGFNQGKIKAYLHNQALIHLKNKIENSKDIPIIIDQFAKKETYYGYLSDYPNVMRENVFFETKAESKYISVACSSVIARHAFLVHMDQLSENAGMVIPKGAGSKVDQAAAEFIKKQGYDNLKYVAKIHFANTNKAKRLL